MKSKVISWICLVIVIAMIVVIFTTGISLWNLIPAFFAFMAIFCHLTSLYLSKYNQRSGKMLDNIAFGMIACFIIVMIVIYFLDLR